MHAVITAADVPWQRPIGVGKDHLPLKTDRVRSLRDEIAAVAADSEEIAEAALRLIRVTYERLPIDRDCWTRPDGSRTPRSCTRTIPGNLAMTFDYAQGDVAQGEAESDVVVEDVFRLHYVTHCCMGVSGVIAEFDPGGNLLLYSNTQVPFLHKREFAELLDIDPARIRIIQPPIGGAFGSKLDIYPFEPIAIFLAKITGRPVKLVFTREEEFLASPTRQPVLLKLRSGCRRDGTLTFRTVETLHDNGAYTSWGATTPFVMMQTISSLYRVPHCLYHTAAIYTNNPYAGSFRGYGNLQATFAVEAHMDKLAEAVGMDGLAFRLKNAQEPGEVTPQGMDFRSCGFRECLQTAAERSDYLRKHAENRTRWERPVADQARHRHGLDAARRRRREDLPVRRMRHDPQDRRLRARDADHRRLRDRPGLGDGARAARLRGTRPAATGRHGRQQRHRHHAVGRWRARFAHDIHRGQLGHRRGAQGARKDPRGGRPEDRARRGRAWVE